MGVHDRRRRSASASATRSCRWCPMFHANAWGLAHAAVASGADAGHARARPVAAGDRRPHRGRAGHRRRRRAHDLDGRAARARRAATPRACASSRAAARRCRKALSEALPRADRAADPAGLGHDRDQPGRHRSAASSRTLDATCPRTSWPTSAPRVACISLGVDFRVVDPTTRRAGAVGRRDVAASCRCAGPWIARDVLQRRPLARVVHRRRLAAHRRRRHRRRRRATSASSTAPRTW